MSKRKMKITLAPSPISSLHHWLFVSGDGCEWPKEGRKYAYWGGGMPHNQNFYSDDWTEKEKQEVKELWKRYGLGGR